jgi:hypothetical protein
VEFSTSGLFPDAVGPFHGHEGIRHFWRRFTEPWERIEIGYEELRELGPDTALVKVRFHGVGRGGDRGRSDLRPSLHDPRRPPLPAALLGRVGAGVRQLGLE